MSPLTDGEPTCDTCGKVSGCSTQTALVLNWGIWQGEDHAGRPKVHVICKDCRRTGKMRPVKKVADFEDEPLF